jgi:hypothetical protein
VIGRSANEAQNTKRNQISRLRGRPDPEFKFTNIDSVGIVSKLAAAARLADSVATS